MDDFVTNAHQKGKDNYVINQTKHIHHPYHQKAVSSQGNAFKHYVESTGQNITQAAKKWNRDKGVYVLGNKPS